MKYKVLVINNPKRIIPTRFFNSTFIQFGSLQIPVENSADTVREEMIGVRQNNKEYLIWGMAYNERWLTTIRSNLNHADVVIYLEVDEETFNLCEQNRDKNKCTAIYFKTFNLSLAQCFDKIDFLKKVESVKLSMQENIINKSKFFLWAHKYDEKSTLKAFPSDIAKLISKTCLSLKDSYYYSQNVFYRCPPELELEEKQENDNKKELKRKRSLSC